MKLNDFEHTFTPSILKRAKAYYRKEHVLIVEEIEEDIWRAIVKGSCEDYHVSIAFKKEGEISHVSCDCPYDWGDPCKHIGAVLYKIRDSKKREVAAIRVENTHKLGLEAMWKLYSSLPAEEKHIVNILAVNWHPLNSNEIEDIYNACGFEKTGAKQSFNFVQSAMPVLFSKQILLKKDKNQYHLPTVFADALCDRFFNTGPDFKRIANVIRSAINSYPFWNLNDKWKTFFRDMRIGRYTDDVELFHQNFYDLLQTRRKEYSWEKIMEYWVGKGFQREKWKALPLGIQAFLLLDLFGRYQVELSAVSTEHLQYTKEIIKDVPGDFRARLAVQIAYLSLFRGDWALIKYFSQYYNELFKAIFSAIKLLQEGQKEAAAAAFDDLLNDIRKLTKKKSNQLTGLEGIFFILSHLDARNVQTRDKLYKYIDALINQGGFYTPVFSFFKGVLLFLENDKLSANMLLQPEAGVGFNRFFLYLCRYWVDTALLNPTVVIAFRDRLTTEGYHWMAAEMTALLEAIGQPADNYPMPAGQAFIYLLPRIEEWETALSALEKIGGKAHKAEQSEYRLAWLVDFENDLVQARHQKLGKNGWSKGRPVSFERLYDREIQEMTEQDHRFIGALDFGHGSEIDMLSYEDYWKYLVGHPLLFLKKSPTTAVQLVKTEPTLVAQKTDKGIQLKFSPNINIDENRVSIIKETPTRYLYLEINQKVVQIAIALNGRSLTIPPEGETKLQRVLSELAGTVKVQSAFEDANLPSIEADQRICLHLLPVGDGFHVEPYVKPFRKEPPYLKPGQGESFLIGAIEGERFSTSRDLEEEKKSLKELKANVSVLKNQKPQNGVWKLEDAASCLELLLQLKPLVEEQSVILEWPRGEKLRIDSVVGFDQFHLAIRDGKSWFELEGELHVDEERVLSLQELLLLSEQGDAFVELGPGKFLALTEEFRKKLQSINGLPGKDKNNNKLLLHPLAAPSLEEFAEAVRHLELGPKFKENRERLKKAFAQDFRTPRSFKAELRAYQKEGYQWLCRCAEWGVGACLADDMGLGKTIQALAFLSRRARLGPALVLAPASVCRNWVSETERFAPKLTPVLFGEGDRRAAMETAEKGSVVIVTYDLMVREAKLFLEKQWATVILDEAQAIKNHATMRSKTAMALNADFRMVMTGTPIENHLGELWNLFQFINPGLLGGLDEFNQRFTLPIEKYKDENRRDQLHRLVKPFILRRRKDEVLKELPEKTEVTLTVELSDEERNFYEALRRNALESLLAEKNEGHPGQQHLRILAELMKLRRAACHPSLADPSTKLRDSSKLQLFGEVVSELLDNGHKALVFSQFVGHLKILAEYLKKQKITYQYLDGSTPGKKRQAAIDAFQNGEGDLFLISLKAGGTGLNLTAADYVIHTDPWWNPAVEDQATDRAHRIGQTRPVTVYRLIAQQTIEEKILKLHSQKRDLADSLLAGTNVSAKLSAEDLMRLLEEE